MMRSNFEEIEYIYNLFTYVLISQTFSIVVCKKKTSHNS